MSALPTCTVCLLPHHCPPSLLNKVEKDQVPGEPQAVMSVGVLAFLFPNTVSVISSEIDVAVAVAVDKS